jgi:hypothetical protein
MHSIHRALFPMLLVGVLLASACGGDAEGGGDGGGLLGGLFGDDPVICPLTGQEAEDETLASRRVLAVKIENSPEARPQMGLAEADVVFEQEAEGGITRFNVLYHCSDSDRIGPIRSARPVDPPILQQFGDPLFVHAGSVDAVIKDVEAAGIEMINCNFEEEVCPRDPEHTAPHDIYTSTDSLRDAGRSGGDPPGEVFAFDEEEPQGKRGREVHLNFSPVADITWRYRGNQDAYMRFHEEEAHDLEDGSQISATNVVVMLVERKDTRISDSAGNPVPSFEVVGSGDVFVFRGGTVIEGTWEREEESAPTAFVDAQGEPIPLAPGTTWVELFPTDAPEPVEF